jgi:hypothetical protein
VSFDKVQINRQLLLFLLLIIFFTPITSSAQGDSPGHSVSSPTEATCTVVNYEILSSHAVALNCSKPVTGALRGLGQLFLNSVADGKQIADQVLLTPSTISRYWILLTWAPATSTSLLPGKTYEFRLPIMMPPATPVTPVTPGEGTPQPDPYVTSISTKNSVAIVAKLLPSKPARFLMTSNVAFSINGKTLAVIKRDPNEIGKRKLVPCKIPITTLTPNRTSINAECSQFDSLPNADLSTLVNVDLSLVGIYDIEIHPLPSTALIPASLPIRDIFGNTPKFDSKARFVRQNACATIQACQLYLNVNYAAGVGTSPAWVLDGKYAPVLTSVKQFFLAPTLAADIGNGTIKGQTYTNTIDIGGTAQRVFLPGQTLQDLVLTVGPTYETDKQFDRDNLLATGDLQFYFAHLYRTQQQEALQDYNRKAATIPSLQLSDIPLRTIGYQLDFHAGTEVGGSLTDTTVNASKGSATEVLPQYPIFRLVPQVHFLLQLGKFSFDESLVGRYLVTTENTIMQTPANTLYLQTVQGWKGISTLTGGFALDAQGNFNLTVTFKDGFAPPTYKRVNAVQAGLLIKY